MYYDIEDQVIFHRKVEDIRARWYNSAYPGSFAVLNVLRKVNQNQEEWIKSRLKSSRSY